MIFQGIRTPSTHPLAGSTHALTNCSNLIVIRDFYHLLIIFSFFEVVNNPVNITDKCVYYTPFRRLLSETHFDLAFNVKKYFGTTNIISFGQYQVLI